MTRSLLYISTLIIFLVSCESTGSEDHQRHFDGKHDKKEVVCFAYHRFGDSRYPSTNIETEVFRQHLQYLKDSSFIVMTMGEALTYLNAPEQPYHSKVIVLTVDDGYKSFLTGAMPLLREFGYNATLFINTESVGGGSYLNWQELKQLMNEGIEIGNHSHTHPYFLDIPETERKKRFEADLNLSRMLFRENLNIDPDLYVYPYGEFDQGMQEVLKSEGFRCALAQNSGVVYGGCDQFAMPRFPVAGVFGSYKRFIEKAHMKALRIEGTDPSMHILVASGRPDLKLTIDEHLPISLQEIQCFIGGSKAGVEIEENRQERIIHVRAEKPIKSRRTLYTITAPSSDHNSWYWYSYPWFCPSCE